MLFILSCYIFPEHFLMKNFKHFFLNFLMKNRIVVRTLSTHALDSAMHSLLCFMSDFSAYPSPIHLSTHLNF